MTFIKGQPAWNKGKTGLFDGEKNPRWKGGVAIHQHGYRLIASPDHPHKSSRGYVREHRLVMEKHLGRFLKPTEDVHHLNHDKTDNRIENLELFSSRSEHLKKYHREDGKATWFKKGQSPHNKTGEYIPCKTCGNDVWVNPSMKKLGKKFCSSKCYGKSKKGVLPPQLMRSI